MKIERDSQEPICLWNDQQIPLSQLAIPVGDIGFFHGVTVSEQVRTFGGRPFELAKHHERWCLGLELLGIKPLISLEQLEVQIAELLAHNAKFVVHKDQDPTEQGICFFATPGSTNLGWATLATSPPAFAIYTYPLPTTQHRFYYDRGVDLVSVEVRDVPNSCWTSSVKIRSRLHYYLAQKQASQVAADAFPVLLDQMNFVSDSSIASIVGWDTDSGIVVRPRTERYNSISVAYLLNLAANQGLPVCERLFTTDQLCTFDEVFLLSTPWCIYPVRKVDNRELSGSQKGFPIFNKLWSTWQQSARRQCNEYREVL